MKKMSPHRLILLSLAAASSLAASPAMAQIFRCNGVGGGAPEYINNARDAQSRGCKAIEGGNVTVVQGTAVPKANPAGTTAGNPPSPVRIASTSPSGSAEQKARDSDARAILEGELQKAEARLAEQKKEFNNGEPEKQGIESRNYQRYLDRVAAMKEAIARNESDIAGLKREIGRLPAQSVN
ncbi:MAG: hypothetical protein EOO28_03110 [Comamonadaceae bacterium]|nr:MAG: hypothetical protein EOO28_03110 [Comamonadaceae bacterium]